MLLISEGGHVLILGREEDNAVPVPLFLEKSISKHCLSGTYTEICRLFSLPNARGIFQTLTSMWYLCEAVSGVSVFKGRHSVFSYP